jgi:hypothetical protein
MFAAAAWRRPIIRTYLNVLKITLQQAAGNALAIAGQISRAVTGIMFSRLQPTIS